MNQAPEIIFIDPRVASRLPTSQAEALEQLAGPDIKPIGYMREDIVTKRILAASSVDREILVMIQETGGILYALSNHGRLWAYGGVDNEPIGWNLMAESELAP